MTTLDDAYQKLYDSQDGCVREAEDALSNEYNVEMKEKIKRFWEHEHFLKSRRWDPDAADDEQVPLSPSEIKRKAAGEYDIEQRQSAGDELKMKQLHQMKLNEGNGETRLQGTR